MHQMSELRVGFLFWDWLIMMIIILDPDVFLKGGFVNFSWVS